MQGTAMRVGQNGKTFHPATSGPFKPQSQENTTTKNYNYNQITENVT